jgi:hypothetical protein
MRSLHHLSEVAAQRKRDDAEDARRAFFQACRHLADELGDDLVGFAVIACNRAGEIRTACESSQGPVSAGLVPTLAGDALNRHIALDMAPPVRR